MPTLGYYAWYEYVFVTIGALASFGLFSWGVFGLERWIGKINKTIRTAYSQQRELDTLRDDIGSKFRAVNSFPSHITIPSIMTRLDALETAQPKPRKKRIAKKNTSKENN